MADATNRRKEVCQNGMHQHKKYAADCTNQWSPLFHIARNNYQARKKRTGEGAYRVGCSTPRVADQRRTFMRSVGGVDVARGRARL